MDRREVSPYGNVGHLAHMVTYGHFFDVVRQLAMKGD